MYANHREIFIQRYDTKIYSWGDESDHGLGAVSKQNDRCYLF